MCIIIKFVLIFKCLLFFNFRNLVDRKFLKSEKISVENNNLTVGILHDKKLTLAPVESVLALKPHLPYLDKTDKRAKQELKEDGKNRLE